MNVYHDLEAVELEPGEILNGKMPIAGLPDGTDMFIPFMIGQGRQSGPTLLITALIHGIEIGGYDTIHRLFQQLDFKKVGGRVIGVPIVNPFALNAASRYTPQDSSDLNRIFPGSAEGTLSQRIAYVLTEKIARHADYIIDYHSCNPPSEFFTIVTNEGSKEVMEASWDMAEAFGAISVSPVSYSRGTFSSYLSSVDKPSITPELVFSRRFDPSSEIGVIGTMNVMKHLKMIDGELQALPNILPFKERLFYTTFTANHGGFIYFHKNMGDAVEKGELFATVKNPWGEVVETLQSPVDGMIIAYPMAGNQAITTGDKIAYFASEK